MKAGKSETWAEERGRGRFEGEGEGGEVELYRQDCEGKEKEEK